MVEPEPVYRVARIPEANNPELATSSHIARDPVLLRTHSKTASLKRGKHTNVQGHYALESAGKYVHMVPMDQDSTEAVRILPFNSSPYFRRIFSGSSTDQIVEASVIFRRDRIVRIEPLSAPPHKKKH